MKIKSGRLKEREMREVRKGSKHSGRHKI